MIEKLNSVVDDERMKLAKIMGSICSNQSQKDVKPPADLSELLQQTEKVTDLYLLLIFLLTNFHISVWSPNSLVIRVSEVPHRPGHQD